MQNSNSAAPGMRSQSRGLGPRGVQSSSSTDLEMAGQSYDLGLGSGAQSSGSFGPLNGEVLQHPNPREQGHRSNWSPPGTGSPQVSLTPWGGDVEATP